ncbi:MAG TPA: alkaline phosphatase D family protein [Chthoniobacteraceae bacterium]|jgi:alkaline phosphatase D|nr:alkaline phosphatase D family protein [Chthoniobacteraceae bacterium]
MSAHPRTPRALTRRDFLADSARLAAASIVAGEAIPLSAESAEHAAPRQAMGTKVGEVTESAALVWTRLTAAAERNRDGVVLKGKGETGPQAPLTIPVAELEGVCPGAAGRVRVRFGPREDLQDAQVTEWAEVSAETDFTHQFALAGLQPATVYHYATETTGPGGAPVHGTWRGRFTTAPAPNAPSDVRFCVLTCLGYPDRDHPDGHPIFPAIQALQPHFVAFTGDNVYYDNDVPRAETPEIARFHWQRMFSLPRPVELLRNVTSYFEKDDHDTCRNDSAPGAKLGALTYAEGQHIFRQQVPLGELSYRTFRWGRDLQIWLTDGRDFRTPNFRPDGPTKTIWGVEQKAWFKRTVAASDATWKVLISPTPLVGPDRGNKNDNHANPGFQTEGDELRGWLKTNAPDLFVICGDRHWQYHSVHPETGLREFSCGPASNSHASGSPGLDPAYHRYHRVKGGFVSVTLRRENGKSAILCEHRDVDGKVQHEWRGAI